MTSSESDRSSDFKYMDSNRGDVSFNLSKATYFHKDYSLPVTDFQLY